MQTPASRTDDADHEDADIWPWQCLECGVTIYHDGECCLDCESTTPLATYGGEASTTEGFLDWMREQPATTFVLKVSAVAGVELALTTFWMRAVLQRSLDLASVLPGVV